MVEKGGRHELKYYISYADFLELRGRMPYVTERDENSSAGQDDDEGYSVRSLYFDNYRDKALFEKIDGVSEREKFRLRLYNGNTSYIRLEKKSKKHGLCYKQSQVISKEDCEQILLGNYEVLKKENNNLYMEFYTKICSQMLRPKNIVEYQREAFVYKAGNVRVTLDYKIGATNDTAQFLNDQLVKVTIPNTIILEVKYDHFLPEIIRGMVLISNRQNTAFSKYAVTRII